MEETNALSVQGTFTKEYVSSHSMKKLSGIDRTRGCINQDSSTVFFETTPFRTHDYAALYYLRAH